MKHTYSQDIANFPNRHISMTDLMIRSAALRTLYLGRRTKVKSKKDALELFEVPRLVRRPSVLDTVSACQNLLFFFRLLRSWEETLDRLPW